MSFNQDPVLPVSYLELEQETTKVVYALATGNAQISSEVVASLCDRFPIKDVAGILLVSLEQLLWLDARAFAWAVEHLLSADLLKAMRQLTAVAIGKQLIDYGFVPGQDFSVDLTGKLLLNDEARKIVAGV